MADVINGTVYSSLATKIGTLITTVQASKSYIYSALTEIATLDDVLPTADLILPFKTVYDVQVNILDSTTNYLIAVRALNDHVINRARQDDGSPYLDINDWFDDQTDGGYPVEVPQKWADLSLQTGVEIDAAYIG